MNTISTKCAHVEKNILGKRKCIHRHIQWMVGVQLLAYAYMQMNKHIIVSVLFGIRADSGKILLLLCKLYY